jgi:hypothetical protein
MVRLMLNAPGVWPRLNSVATSYLTLRMSGWEAQAPNILYQINRFIDYIVRILILVFEFITSLLSALGLGH